ncbi:hypothetical protein BDZ89DRAFT_1050731 [Hymenopellis radicata]|nr:hypothetical protein BDZ89DRAFT_1053067 [Hymenopellis radicata]KAF9001039.1 hypothetical protein BDZ89DRAFT_1050731 [Hymenopellis radicata]
MTNLSSSRGEQKHVKDARRVCSFHPSSEKTLRPSYSSSALESELRDKYSPASAANYTSEETQKNTNKENEASVIRPLLARRLTRKMLKVVSNIQADRRVRLPHPGSYLQMVVPLLEFVKCVSAVFGLAKEYPVEIGLLKRNLLELVGVKESGCTT